MTNTWDDVEERNGEEEEIQVVATDLVFIPCHLEESWRYPPIPLTLVPVLVPNQMKVT